MNESYDNILPIFLNTFLAIDPVRFLIAICIFSNIGGASTMVGDPPNVLIANDPT